MEYEIPKDPYTEKDKKYIWICESCKKVIKTAEDIKPDKCPDCFASKEYIDKYHNLL